MGAEVRFEDGRRGQFDILVDGKLVVTRKGGLLAKLFRKPWPRDEDVVEAVQAAVGSSPG